MMPMTATIIGMILIQPKRQLEMQLLKPKVHPYSCLQVSWYVPLILVIVPWPKCKSFHYLLFQHTHFRIARPLPRKTTPLDRGDGTEVNSAPSQMLRSRSDGNPTCTKPGKGTQWLAVLIYCS